VAVLTGYNRCDEASRFNVRVLNLALSSSSPLPAGSDPLVRALDGLWHMGIVVGHAPGNGGPARGSVTSPGNARPCSPRVTHEMGTAAHHDDVVPPGRAGGMGQFKPDLVAPAVSVISLRAVGSSHRSRQSVARIGS